MTVTEVINFSVWGAVFAVLIVQFFRSIRLVPTKKAYIVERLGNYRLTLKAGFHALVPFFDNVSFKLDLKEETIDVPPQECFTLDEVRVEVDGVMYVSVVDPVRAAYGITNYRFAAMQLAQTTTRSVLGTIDLDRTFEERELISSRVVQVLSEAGRNWGIQVHRYEIKNISPPQSVTVAMEKQVTAERERRAIVATADGQRQSMINRSEGKKQDLINHSEGDMQSRINDAEGQAEAMLSVAAATADSIRKVADAIQVAGGDDAIRLQVIEKYISSLGNLANPSTKLLLPADLSNFDALLKSAGLDPRDPGAPSRR
jgi:regulator of protease activity HflC (stomatin/prohibitin superfamily)